MGKLGGTALAGVLFSNDRGKFTAATHVTRGENLSPVQRFARFFGAAYPLVGLTEVYPASPARWPVARGPRTPRRVAVGSVRLPLVPQPDACDHRDNRPLVYRTFRTSRAHALALGVAYAVPILFGVFVRDVCSLGDLLFIDGTDDMLHVLTSFGVFVAYLTTRLLENERGAASPRL